MMIKLFHRSIAPVLFWQPLVLGLVGFLLGFQLNAAPALATGVYDMPTVSAGDSTWVIDEADVLNRLTEGNLSNRLQKLAEDTGTEVRFVTFHRFDYGENAQSFTDKLFETWFPTPTDRANQVLVVLENLTNTSAIHTGESAKALVTDAIAESVAQETLQVPLRKGDKYNQAFSDVSDRLALVLTGEPDPGPPIVEDTINVEGTFATAEETDDGSATLIVVVLLVAATVIPMLTYFLYVR